MSGEDRTIPERPVGDFVACQWIRDEDGVWSHMQFQDDEDEGTEQRLRGMTW